MTGTAREKPFGTCPHCGARIELPAGSQRCAACNGPYLTIVPEEDAAGTSAEGPGEWMLLPLASTPERAARGLAGWLDARALRRPLRALAMLEAIGIAGLFSAGTLLAYLDPGPRTRSVLEQLLLFFLFMIALPAIALVAAPVVGVLFSRRRANEPRDFWRSVIAVTLGVATCWAAVLLLSIARVAAPAASWRWLEPDGVAIPALLPGLLAYLLAGWLTGRLAPGAPFRHALGVWLLLVLPSLPGLLSVRSGVALAALLVQASMLWLGAWLGVRSRPPVETPAAAA